MLKIDWRERLSRAWASGDLPLIFLALVKFGLHLATSLNYGYFIDELYTVAMGRHLAGGFVDVPPLVPFIAGGWISLFGASLFSIRFLAALAGAGTVYMAGRVGREMGLKPFGQCLTALAVIFCPVFLAFNSFLAYDGFDQLFTSAFFFIAVKLFRGGDKRLWIALGAAAGTALMAKYTMLFLGLAFVIGLIISDRRKDLLTPWPWLGGLAAVLIALPWGLWQGFHGWPVIEYWRMYARQRVYRANLVEFILMQAFSFDFVLVPVYAAGLIRLLFAKSARDLRVLGVTAFAAFGIFFLTHAQMYMSASLYPLLFASGAMCLQEWMEKGKRSRAWAAWSVAAAMAFTGIYMIPNALPLFGPERTLAYIRHFDSMWSALRKNQGGAAGLPQIFADRFGWTETVEATARVFGELSPEEKSDCIIFTAIYGQAGAIDLLGPKYGLPKACSGHLSYYLWGYGGKSGETLISVGVSPGLMKRMYEEVRVADRADHSRYAMPYVRDAVICLCRKPREPIATLWKKYAKQLY